MRMYVAALLAVAAPWALQSWCCWCQSPQSTTSTLHLTFPQPWALAHFSLRMMVVGIVLEQNCINCDLEKDRSISETDSSVRKIILLKHIKMDPGWQVFGAKVLAEQCCSRYRGVSVHLEHRTGFCASEGHVNLFLVRCLCFALIGYESLHVVFCTWKGRLSGIWCAVHISCI